MRKPLLVAVALVLALVVVLRRHADAELRSEEEITLKNVEVRLD